MKKAISICVLLFWGGSLLAANSLSAAKVIHVIVALCDNKYQGIVPVPEKIGNGQDPANNLYWGCGYGVKTFFKKSSEWKLISTKKMAGTILERIVFKHTTQNVYLIADAYNGMNIKEATVAFFQSLAGSKKDTLQIGNETIGINGYAALVAYVGHDGLMDFSLNEKFANTDNKKRDAIMLACVSKKYFATHIAATGANPLLWSTGLMSPEAYTLKAAINGYLSGSSAESIRSYAATAYNTYQKCGIKGAMRLLVTGW